MLNRRTVVARGALGAIGLITLDLAPSPGSLSVLTPGEEIWLFFEGAALHLDHLGEADRARVVRGFFRDGRPVADVAAALGVSESEVAAVIGETIRAIQGVIADTSDDPEAAR